MARARTRCLVIASIIVGVLMLSSCSAAPPSSSSQGTSNGTTKPYGSLTVDGGFSAGRFDPQISTGATFHTIGAAIFDSIVELTHDALTKPGLAERWEIADDGKTHTFFIRKGVKFHDGSDLTGADVKFSIERILAPESTHVDAAVWRSQIDRAELKDDYTVVLHLKLPQFELLKGFMDLSGSASVVPKKYIEEKGVDYFRKNLMGSGPWRVLKYEVGTRMELEAVENHWRARPQFKNVTILEVPEEGTKIAMLKTGELDIAQISPDSVAAVKAAGLRIYSYDAGGQWFAPVFYDIENPQKYALGDVRVRKALSFAINRKEMADKLVGGYGEPLALWYVSPTAFFWDSNVLKPDPFDPEGAKKLLAEAGYSSGFNTKLWDSGRGAIGSQQNLALAEYWRRIGVDAEIAPIDGPTLSTMWSPKHKPEIWNSIWSTAPMAGGALQFEKMVIAYHSTKGVHKNLKNPRLDELIDKVPLTRDPAEKKKLALEAAVLAKNEYSHLPILGVRSVIALNAKVGEYKPIPGLYLYATTLETITHAK